MIAPFVGMRFFAGLLILLVTSVVALPSQAGLLEMLFGFGRQKTTALPLEAPPVDRQCAELFIANVLSEPAFPYESRTMQMKDGADLFLGEGYSAQIFLARDPNDANAVVIKKIYKQNAFGTARYHYDIEGLNALKADQSLTAEDEATAPFEVARGERYMEPALTEEELPRVAVRLRFVEGRTVHSLILDPTISDAVKKKVAENYAAKLNNLENRLQSSGDLKTAIEVLPEEARYFFDGKTVDLKMLKTESKTGGELLIKSDNVVVDPYDLDKMTIVDPY